MNNQVPKHVTQARASFLLGTEPPTPGAILKTYWNDVVTYTLKFSLFPRAEEAATG